MLLLDGLAIDVLGYLLACVLPFTLVALHRRRSLAREFATGVAASPLERRAGVLLMVVGFGLAVLHALLIARHYA